ncbi:class I SAM-dependent methyltransferase [Roseovarius atlanticus]|uniref:class I SAM-dependent methyltransferase n=1 Tax=Roseovarius atlanticus TaxID=1641875 RepID=UPI001C94A14F|nr:methyltransferase domain-containing protein [Roseovarius atlanticus]MBY5986646.1 methyltransferase domain-containing protein [Roseovarius atlanticus]MBY6125286.1 methyltransferase domain-containing protein [Roseovarius atlanticus]MBY6150253.1 methyltransferase domain-containing protein [Roseovarius atlanticus]
MDSRTLSPEARMWGQTGTAYDGISFGLSDTIGHTVQALWPRPGERVLDIGTGTGWAARLAALRGARVTGVDIAPGMLSAAEALSAGCEPQPVFREAAAEALPFENASFDGVMSTYGVIFAADPGAAVAEMARVLRPGGRLALATWADDPDGYIARFFALVGAWSDAPPPASSPFDWGRPDWLRDALAGLFEFESREQVTTLYAPDTATVWHEYVSGFGPVAATHGALPEERRAAFRDAFEAFHAPYETGTGLVIPRLARVVRGRRTGG